MYLICLVIRICNFPSVRDNRIEDYMVQVPRVFSLVNPACSFKAAARYFIARPLQPARGRKASRTRLPNSLLFELDARGQFLTLDYISPASRMS
jgi:hypothetical protein